MRNDMRHIQVGDIVIQTYGSDNAALKTVTRVTKTQIIILDNRGSEDRYRSDDGQKVGGYSRSTPFANRYEIAPRGDAWAERALERSLHRSRVQRVRHALDAFDREQTDTTAEELRNAVERLTQQFKS